MATIGKQLFYSAIIFGAVGGYIYYDQHKGPSAPPRPTVAQQIASDESAKYEIVRKAGGSPSDLCRQAGFAANAWLDAKDERLYREWKSTKDTDCRRAEQ